MMRTGTLFALLCLAGAARAEHPLRHPVDAMEARFASSQPIVRYTLRVDAADLGGFDVEMRIRNAPDTFRLAMAAHPEYDDRFWRFVDGLRVTAGTAPARVVREDSALWRVIAPGGESVVRYRIRLPAADDSRQRGSWRPFLAPTGGLVGGPHAFMYVLDATLAPVHVVLDLPAGWDAASGLTPTSDPRTFFAPSVEALVESPILAGRLRSWRFQVDDVPHRVVYWPLPDAVPFDTVALVGNLERLARQAVALFGRAPYREYTFLLQDGAYGGLEHANSVTLGAPSTTLAENPPWLLEEAAHEFLHTWNLVRIRPAGRGGLSHRPFGRTTGLWFSEGLTMYYADLLLRRAGLPTRHPTRLAHLEAAIARYLANAGNTNVSPERASYNEYGGGTGANGDYDPSVHLQGELLGAMLDIVVREATDGRRSMDDVMRAMLERYSGERAFTGPDIERTVAEVCGCDVRAFFAAHVREGTPIDFDRYLRLLGLRPRVAWKPALGRDERPAADARIFAWEPEGEQGLRLHVIQPRGSWGRAGLHTGDRLVSANGARIATWQEFRGMLSRLAIGDTVRVEVTGPTGPWRTTVTVTGYDVPSVAIEEIVGASERQRTLRARWLAGTPDRRLVTRRRSTAQSR